MNFEELLESLGIRHRFVTKESMDNYPNVPAMLLPEGCKVSFPKDGKVLTRISQWKSFLTWTDFSNNGHMDVLVGENATSV